MLKLTIKIRPIPKPCGRIMNRKIVMNPVKVLADGTNYGTWKENAGILAKASLIGTPEFKLLPIVPYGIIYLVYCPLARKDLSNCFESVQDALVEAGILVDDRLSCLPRITGIHKKSKVMQYKIYICQTRAEWLNCLSKL